MADPHRRELFDALMDGFAAGLEAPVTTLHYTTAAVEVRWIDVETMQTNYVPPTEEEIQAAREREAAAAEARKARIVEQKRVATEAAARAYELLKQHLTKKQHHEALTLGRFVVKGSDGKLYGIYPAQFCYGIVPAGGVRCAYGFHEADAMIAPGDRALARKLWVENDVLRVQNEACKSPWPEDHYRGKHGLPVAPPWDPLSLSYRDFSPL